MFLLNGCWSSTLKIKKIKEEKKEKENYVYKSATNKEQVVLKIKIAQITDLGMDVKDGDPLGKLGHHKEKK